MLQENHGHIQLPTRSRNFLIARATKEACHAGYGKRERLSMRKSPSSRKAQSARRFRRPGDPW